MSPLPLTDPRVAEAQRMLDISIASYGNQTISSTRQISTVGVINLCSTTIRRLCHSPEN